MSARSAAPPTDERVLVEIDRARVRLVVSIATFASGPRVSVREFYVSADGVWAPGRKGITFPIDELDRVVAALQGAR